MSINNIEYGGEMKEGRTVVYTEHFIIDVQEAEGGVSVTGWKRKADGMASDLVDNIVFIKGNGDKKTHSIRPTILSDSP